jgi:hypothetical protein
MAASVNCPEVYDELFARGTQPQYYCTTHGNGALVSDMSGGIGVGQPGLAGSETGAGQPGLPDGESGGVLSGLPEGGDTAIPPTLVQNDSAGETITIWNTDSNVPDFSVPGDFYEQNSDAQDSTVQNRGMLNSAAQNSGMQNSGWNADSSNGQTVPSDMQDEIVIFS